MVGESCSVCERAMSSSPSFTSQGELLKLTTVEFVKLLGIANKCPVDEQV